MSKYLIENLFGIEGWSIAWYGVIIAVGMVLGVILAIYRARKQGLKDDLIFDFILLALPIAIVCARGYYVVFEWNSYSGDILSIFKIWKGGLAIYGGVIGGLVTAILFCHYHKFPLFRFLDLVVPSLVLGQAIGRWGNFVNQEAFGNLVANPSLQLFPYAVYIDALGEWHQATFFYESMWNVCLLRIDSSPVPVSGKAWYIVYSVRAIRKSQEETHDYAKYTPLSRPSHIKKATEMWSHPVFRTVFGEDVNGLYA